MGAFFPQKILKTRIPEMPFPAIWAFIFSPKIAIGDDLIINLNKVLLWQDQLVPGSIRENLTIILKIKGLQSFSNSAGKHPF